MATNTLSQHSSIVKENSPISIDFLNKNTPVVSSVDIAKHFQKKHKHVLEEIRKMQAICPKSFYGPNFRPVDYVDAKGEKRLAYQLTRDGFSALVMGFTGKAALLWRIRYIEAFNALEAAVLHNHTELARQSAYQQGLDEARTLPAAEVERKTAYLNGLHEGRKLQKRQDGLKRLVKAHRYTSAGLSQGEVGAALGMSANAVGKLLARAKKHGLLAMSHD